MVVMLILLAGLVIGGYYLLHSAGGRARWDKLKLHLPEFGGIIRNFYLARLGEALATLIKAGVPILDGLTITADVVGNESYKQVLLEARANVQNGGSISEVLQRYEIFPSLMSSMLAIGERTGRTDYMLENVTRFYRAETENAVQNLTQLIEPILILILGLAVGLIVSAVLLPIYSLVGAQG